jgi:hypothetical protein
MLWRLRVIQLHGGELSHRPLCRDTTPCFRTRAPAFDEDANGYAKRLQEVSKQVVKQPAQAVIQGSRTARMFDDRSAIARLIAVRIDVAEMTVRLVPDVRLATGGTLKRIV